MTDDLAIPGFLDRTKNKPLVGTFTMMNCYENICAHQAYHRYIAKSTPYVETPAMKQGNEGHAAFEHRVGGGKPLPVDFQKWEPFAAAFDGYSAQVEQKLGLTAEGQPCGFFDGNVRFRVKIDVSLVSGETAHITDWKFGSSKFEDPLELAIGAMHLHAKHPQLKKISGHYIWLKEDRVGQTHDLSDTLATWTRANKILQSMEDARLSGEWPKKPSGLCSWCDVKSCEHRRERK